MLNVSQGEMGSDARLMDFDAARAAGFFCSLTGYSDHRAAAFLTGYSFFLVIGKFKECLRPRRHGNFLRHRYFC